MELNSVTNRTLRPLKRCTPEICEADSTTKRRRFVRGDEEFTAQDIVTRLETALATGPEEVQTIMHDYSMIKAGCRALVRVLRMEIASQSD